MIVSAVREQSSKTTTTAKLVNNVFVAHPGD